MHDSDEIYILFLSIVLKAFYRQFKPYKVDRNKLDKTIYHKNQQNKNDFVIIYFLFICYFICQNNSCKYTISNGSYHRII